MATCDLKDPQSLTSSGSTHEVDVFTNVSLFFIQRNYVYFNSGTNIYIAIEDTNP